MVLTAATTFGMSELTRQAINHVKGEVLTNSVPMK